MMSRIQKRVERGVRNRNSSCGEEKERRGPRSIWKTEAVVKRRPIPERVVPPRSQQAGRRQMKTSPILTGATVPTGSAVAFGPRVGVVYAVFPVASRWRGYGKVGGRVMA